jgi:hypothetical protein
MRRGGPSPGTRSPRRRHPSPSPAGSRHHGAEPAGWSGSTATRQRRRAHRRKDRRRGGGGRAGEGTLAGAVGRVGSQGASWVGGPGPGQATPFLRGMEARGGAWFREALPLSRHHQRPPQVCITPLCKAAGRAAGVAEGKVGEARFSDSRDCRGRDRGGGRDPCPRRFARARRDGHPRRRLGRASAKARPSPWQKPHPGPALSDHCRTYAAQARSGPVGGGRAGGSVLEGLGAQRRRTAPAGRSASPETRPRSGRGRAGWPAERSGAATLRVRGGRWRPRAKPVAGGLSRPPPPRRPRRRSCGTAPRGAARRRRPRRRGRAAGAAPPGG